MSIFDPEVASAFGGIDSDAVVDGYACSAALQRAIAMVSNRLATRGHELFNYVWPEEPHSDDGDSGLKDNMEVFLYPFWRPITPPIVVPKKPGLNRANLRMRVKVTSGDESEFQLETIDDPFSPTHGTHIASHTGTGSFAWVTLDDVPINVGSMERMRVWGRSLSQGALGDTATYGSPNSATLSAGAGDVLYRNAVKDVSNTWTAPPDDWSSGGFMVWFEDASGNYVAVPRKITSTNLSNDEILFSPDLTDVEFSGARNAIITGSGVYSIRKLTDCSICNIMAFSPDLVV